MNKDEKVIMSINNIRKEYELKKYIGGYVILDPLDTKNILNLIDNQQKEIEQTEKMFNRALKIIGNQDIAIQIKDEIIDKLIEEKATDVMCYDTEEDKQKYIKHLKEDLYKEMKNAN